MIKIEGKYSSVEIWDIKLEKHVNVYGDERLLTETQREQTMGPSAHGNLAVLCRIPHGLYDLTLTNESHGFGL